MYTRRTRRRRLSGLRRYYKRSRLPRYNTRRRRIFNRFIRRTAVKPELKWVLTTYNRDISTQGTDAFTPSLLGQGTSVNQHVGGQCSFVKVDYRLLFVDNTAATAYQGSNIARFIIWTPRQDLAKSKAYMNGINVTNTIDINYVTVIKDMLVYTSPGKSGNNSGPYAYQKIITGKFLFPRKVKFPSYSTDATDLDDEKEVAYITYMLNTGTVTMYIETKLWFFDS